MRVCNGGEYPRGAVQNFDRVPRDCTQHVALENCTSYAGSMPAGFIALWELVHYNAPISLGEISCTQERGCYAQMAGEKINFVPSKSREISSNMPRDQCCSKWATRR